jgi:hypothetical protein
VGVAGVIGVAEVDGTAEPPGPISYSPKWTSFAGKRVSTAEPVGANPTETTTIATAISIAVRVATP